MELLFAWSSWLVHASLGGGVLSADDALDVLMIAHWLPCAMFLLHFVAGVHVVALMLDAERLYGLQQVRAYQVWGGCMHC